MKNIKIKIVLIFLAGLTVIAASFLAGRLINSKMKGSSFLNFNNDESNTSMTSFESFEPAPEIPETKVDFIGILSKREDNILIIKEIPITYNEDGSATAYFDAQAEDVPVVEVVVTKKTQIYLDTTDYGTSEMDSVQQTVKPLTLEKINPDALVSVWGKKVGDRINADVIVVTGGSSN
jgi:hypothetical protein